MQLVDFVVSAPVTIPMGQLGSGEVCHDFEIQPNEGNSIDVSLTTAFPLFLRNEEAGSAIIIIKNGTYTV